MKKVKYILFLFLLFFFGVFYVQASCTDEEINNLKEEASKIKITYKHMGILEEEEQIRYNTFQVYVKNMNDDLYISLLAGSEKLVPTDGTASIQLQNGKWDFTVFSEKCGVEIDNITVKLPRFNMYSLDPLCEGIDGDDFALCGKYYEYDVSYENFVQRVQHYRSIHNVMIDNNDSDDDLNTGIIDTFISFLNNYRLYIIISLFVILIVVMTIVIMNRRKKRWILK